MLPKLFNTPCLRRRQRGFTLIEVSLSLVIFAMMTLMFAAVFPMAVRGAQYSSRYAQAAALGQHKMDQLRTAGYSRLFNPTGQNGLSSLNVINSVNPDGSYDFTQADSLVNDGVTHGPLPPGSRGTVTVANYTQGGVPGGTVALVTVSLTWTGGGVADGSYKAVALIAKAGQP